jgi:tetratricopeptide (TPR) repeat protein
MLFGGLVPYGRIWRVGANESTKFTTDTGIEVLGNHLSPGTYALYAFPGKEVWEVVFHKNTTHWGDGRDKYDPDEDAFRVKIRPQKSPIWQENFRISFDSISHNSAIMEWKWGNTLIAIPLEVNTRRKMMESIDSSLSGTPNAQSYYEAARYLQEEGIEYQQALKYLDKAIVLGGDTYYFQRVRSLVLAALRDYEAAIQAAGLSAEMAEAEGKDEFVRMNQINIAKWKELLEELRD